jgi:hypothetical protein
MFNSRMTSAASGGAVAVVASATASADATVDFSGVFTSAYDRYSIEFYGVQGSASANFRMRVESGGSFISTSTYRAHIGISTSASAGWAAIVDNPDDHYRLTTTFDSSGDSTIAVNGSVDMWNPNSTTINTYITSMTTTTNTAGAAIGGPGWGHWDGIAAVTGVQFLFSTGNVSVGTFVVYGIKSA